MQPPTINPMLAGLVIAGGRSRRFGRDKALAMLGGRPLLAWSLAALREACAEVAINAEADSGAAGLAVTLAAPVVSDDPDHPQGPLAGLAAGLKWAAANGFGALATLPCDTPYIEAHDIALLHAALGDASAAYARTASGVHGLCAVWRVDLRDALADRLAAGDHPPIHHYLREIGARALDFPDEARFLNINRLQDLES